MIQVTPKDVKIDDTNRSYLNDVDATSSDSNVLVDSIPIIFFEGTSSTSNVYTVESELSGYSTEARARIMRGLVQEGTIDRGSFADFLD